MTAVTKITQTHPLPNARAKTYTNKVAFDTYIIRNAQPSQNQDIKLAVKKDDPCGPEHSISYLGFNAEKYNIPDIIGSLKIKLHVTKNNLAGDIDVYLITEDSFWDIEFTYESRPHTDSFVTSFSTSDSDPDGWLTLDISNMDVINKFRNDGKLSFALMANDNLVYHEFSSSQVPDYAPLLQLITTSTECSSSNAIRYINFIAAENENNFDIVKISEINLINAEGHIEKRDKWQVIEGSHLSNWENMFDGSSATYWEALQSLPVYFTLDLGKPIDIKALVYTPQSSGYNGRASDILIYGSADGNEWDLIGSRAIKHGDGNAPHIIFTGTEASFSQVEDSYSFPVKTAWSIEKNRLKNNAGRSPLNVTGLYFNQPGIVCLWIDDKQADDGDFLEAREGHWDGSTRHRLQYGLNSFLCDADKPLYLQIASNSSSDNSRVASVRIMASNALYYPVFKTHVNTQSEWFSMIDAYSNVNYYEMVTEKIILGMQREYFSPFRDEVKMQELADTYDECTVPTQLAAGLRDDDENPIHCPDVNPYHYVPSEKGYMTTFQNRITYHTDLTKRMIIPSEVRSFWGIWHEMGHNLQTTGLNWPGQVEVAVNIYAFAERAYTKTLGSLVTSYDPDFKTTYNALKNVDTYPQLPDADRERLFHHLFFIFGETFMHMLHRRYRENMIGEPCDPEFIIGASADEQMNVMAIIASKVARKNLTNFFKFWKFNLTKKTVTTINNYNLEVLSGFEKLPSDLVKGQPDGRYDMRF